MRHGEWPAAGWGGWGGGIAASRTQPLPASLQNHDGTRNFLHFPHCACRYRAMFATSLLRTASRRVGSLGMFRRQGERRSRDRAGGLGPQRMGTACSPHLLRPPKRGKRGASAPGGRRWSSRGCAGIGACVAVYDTALAPDAARGRASAAQSATRHPRTATCIAPLAVGFGLPHPLSGRWCVRRCCARARKPIRTSRPGGHTHMRAASAPRPCAVPERVLCV